MPTKESWEEFVKTTDLDLVGFNVYKDIAYIKKVGKEWCVKSEAGKPMGCYPSRKQAEDRLKDIEMFRHMKSGDELASQECWCHSCGNYFFTNRRCDLVRCPVCGDPDSSIEVTGLTD